MFEIRSLLSRLSTIHAAVLVAGFGMGTGSALADPHSIAHCVTPTNIDLNERYDIDDVILAPFCAEAPSGRKWTVSNGWFMSLAYDATAPGFVPAGATPLEDFIAKLVGVKYVVDAGTKHERTHFFRNGEDLGIFVNADLSAANTAGLGSLKPLSVGTHSVDSFLVFRAMHCDGFGDVVEENCLPAGETLFSSFTFTVKPGNH